MISMMTAIGKRAKASWATSSLSVSRPGGKPESSGRKTGADVGVELRSSPPEVSGVKVGIDVARGIGVWEGASAWYEDTHILYLPRALSWMCFSSLENQVA